MQFKKLLEAKVKIVACFLILFSLNQLTFAFIPSNWSDVGQPIVQAGDMFATRMAVDQHGIPYVIYETNNGVMVKKFDKETGQWTQLGQSLKASGPSTTDIAISSSGVPYISFDGSGIAVRKYDASSQQWVPVGNLGALSRINALGTRLAIDPSSDLPVLIYMDSANVKKVTVYKYDAVNNWQQLGDIAFYAADNTPATPVIAINHSGQIYIAFQEANTEKLKVMTYNNKSGPWQSIDIGSIPSESYKVSIALDSQGNPYIAYIDGTASAGSSQSGVFKWSPSTAKWITVGESPIPLVGFNSRQIDIALDHNDTPYVSFPTEYNHQVAVMKYNSSNNSWVKEYLTTEGDSFFETSLKISSHANQLYLACYSNDIDGKKINVKSNGPVVKTLTK